jgi:thiopurine S-methyltransferase
MFQDHSNWKARWDEGRIAFHQERGNPRLRAHWDALLQWCGPPHAAEGSEVLVPLCGKTADLHFLAERKHRVVGVEFVQRAAEDYFLELGVSARIGERGRARSYRHERTEIVVHDFFSLTGDTLGRANLAYDRAALVAVPPERRHAYVATLADLVQPGGALLLVSFEHDTGSGPPFSLPEVTELFADSFDIEQREKRDILGEEPRFRERGATHMHEVVWYARRKT